MALALVMPAAANDSGEIWITAQNTNELKILSGNDHIETVPLPALGILTRDDRRRRQRSTRMKEYWAARRALRKKRKGSESV